MKMDGGNKNTCRHDTQWLPHLSDLASRYYEKNIQACTEIHEKQQHTDPLCKNSWKDTHKSKAAQLSWYSGTQFVLEVSSKERARPSVTVCTAELTLILIKCTGSCSRYMHHFWNTNLFQAKVGQALQVALLCKKRHMSLFVLRR